MAKKKYFEAKGNAEAKETEVNKQNTKEDEKMNEEMKMTLGQKVGNTIGKGIDGFGNGVKKVTSSKAFKVVAGIGTVLGAVGVGYVLSRNNDDDGDDDEYQQALEEAKYLDSIDSDSDDDADYDGDDACDEAPAED